MADLLDDCTISINGGPDVPVAVARQVMADMAIDKRLGRVGHLKDTPDERKRINSLRVDDDGNDVGGEIRAFIERYEALEAEKKDLVDDMKEVMAEARGRGYQVSVLRKIVALRKRNKDDIDEEDAIMALYLTALGEG